MPHKQCEGTSKAKRLVNFYVLMFSPTFFFFFFLVNAFICRFLSNDRSLLKLFKMNAIDQKKNVYRFVAARNKRVWNRQKHECEYRFVFVCV